MAERLTVEDVPVDVLAEFPGNPRRGDVDAVARSLQAFGQYRPIVVNARTKQILAGAGRGGAQANFHPTVKPVALMRWLVRLVTPPGGTVLEPFTGSGTTLVAAVLEGFDAVGVELTADYLPIIEARVAWAQARCSDAP